VHPISVVEVEYSLASRVIEKELLNTCRELGVGIVAYGVLSRGLLSGGLTGAYAMSDFRAHAPRFTGENFVQNRKRVALLEEMAKAKECTPSQLAIAWVLHRGDDILPLIGTTKRNRLYENLAAAEVRLNDEEMKRISDAFPEGSFAGARYAEPQMAVVVN
jgi:aryl-alcohol dehydrogenase-like predicted oxidoreductase